MMTLVEANVFAVVLAQHIVPDRKAYRENGWCITPDVLRQRVVAVLRAEVLNFMHSLTTRKLDPWTEIVSTGSESAPELHVGFGVTLSASQYNQLAYDLKTKLPAAVGTVWLDFGHDARAAIYVTLNADLINECTTPVCLSAVVLASQVV